MIFARIYAFFERLCSNAVFLITVVVLIICLFMASSYQAYRNSLDETVQYLKVDVGNKTKAIASSIEEYFRGKKEFVRLMTDFLLVQEYLNRVRQDTITTDPRFDDLCSLLKTVSGPDKSVAIAWLGSLRDEYSLSYDDVSYEKDGWSTRTRPWFAGTMAAEDIYFSDPYWDFETGDVCVSLVKKVYRPPSDDSDGTKSSEVVGVAGLDLFFPPIRKIMDEFVQEDVCYPILISHDGSILYHPNMQFVFKSKLENLDPILGQFSTEIMHSRFVTTHLITLDKGRKPVYFGYVPVDGTDWSVGIIWEKSDAEKTLLTFERTLMRSLLLNLLLFVIPIGFFSIVIINRSRRFLKMKRLYDIVVDQMQTGIAVVDPETDSFLLTNPAYEEFLDLPPQGAVSFSKYYSKLGIVDLGGTYQMTSTCPTMPEGATETPEIQLPLKESMHYFTHFFAEFRDYVGRELILSVLTDVTELKKMQERLRVARDAAESASRAKSSFLANMSHEIRTPMNGIIGLTDLLATSDLNAVQSRYVELVQSSAASLLTIINDILDHSKIEAGKLLIESYIFDLHRFLGELTFSFTHAAERKSLSFRTTISPDVPQYVRGDANRLRQVLSNFLGNAVKFTETGGVDFRVVPLSDPGKTDFVRFEIADSGIGISEDQLDRLFKPFEQADSSMSRKFGGTGLGLSISQSLLRLMGGDVDCRSQPEVGSVFGCELPLPKTSSDLPMQSGPDISIPESRPLHILLVDDVKINRIVLSSMLRQWGHITESVENGSQAIKRMKEHRYDLVFMDCQMPEMDGYECTQMIRRPETGVLQSDVPIIAVTAHAMIGDKERCLASGMNDYISKPIDHVELQSKLAQWAN